VRQKPRVLFTGFSNSGELLIPAQVAMALDGRICESFLAVGRLFDTVQSRSLEQQIEDAIADTAPSAIFFLGKTTLDHVSIESRVSFLDPTTRDINFLASTLPVDRIVAALGPLIPQQRQQSPFFTAEDTAIFYNGLRISQQRSTPIPAGPITLPEHLTPLDNSRFLHYVGLMERAGAMAISARQPVQTH